MSSSSNSTPTIEPSLDSHPRENLETWLAAVGTAARKYCATHSQFGALHLACTDALWNALNPPVGGAPTPRPNYPRPAPLVGNETAGVRTVHAAELKLYQDHADAEAELRQCLLTSIGLTNQRAIKVPILGLHNLTTNDIVQAMITRHGTHTESDLAKFRQNLDVTLTKIENFDAHTIEFESNVSKLATDDPISVYQAYVLFTKTLITPFPAFSQHVTNYVSAHPLPQNRDTTSLATFLRIHIPTIDAHTRGQPFAGYTGTPLPPPQPASASPAPAPAPATPRKRNQNRQAKEIAALKAQLNALQTGTPPPPTTHHAQAPPPSPPLSASATATSMATTVATGGLAGLTREVCATK